MSKNLNEYEHFNLYYIFSEDKKKNLLTQIQADILRRRIFEKISNDQLILTIISDLTPFP